MFQLKYLELCFYMCLEGAAIWKILKIDKIFVPSFGCLLQIGCLYSFFL